MTDGFFDSDEDSLESERELIVALEKYISAQKENCLDELLLSQEEIEYIIDYFADQNDLDAALRASELGLSRYPLCFELIARYCDALISLGKHDKALETLETFKDTFYNYPDIFFLQSRALINKEDFVAARKQFLEALSKENDNEDLLDTICCLAQDCIEVNNFEEAIYYFNQALKHGKLSAIYLNDFAYCYDRIQKLDKAIQYYNEYLDIDPFNDIVWFNLGTVYARDNDIDKAINAFDFALALDSKNESAVYNLAAIYLRSENYTQALKYFQLYCTLDPKGVTGYMGIADVYLGLNDISKAKEYYIKALELEPNNYDVKISLNCLCAIEDFENGDKEAFAEILSAILPKIKNKDLENLDLIKKNIKK